MVLRMRNGLVVKDLRNHPAETVERLRTLLAAGGTAYPDPKRENFYELEDGHQVYYVYVYPRGDKVLFLATWLKEAAAELACDRAGD
jgi:hypothetical protein